VVLTAVVVAVVSLIGLFVLVSSIAGPQAEYSTATTMVFGPPSEFSFPVAGGAPASGREPPAVVPPADAAEATAAIIDLYGRVFTPGTSDELWDSWVTEPAGLRERLRALGAGRCALDLRVVVTGVEFTSDLDAQVRFRFEGPNIPAAGDTIVFTGAAVREPGGSWKATPEGLEQVLGLAAGYC
jgi:hypothetical protein